MHASQFVPLVLLLASACSPAGGGTPTTGAPTSGTTEAASTTGSSTGATGSTGPAMTDTGTAGTDGSGGTTGGLSCMPVEGACREHEDCPSGYCESFSSAPPDPDATCEPAQPEGTIRLTGTVRDFVTRAPVAASMRIAGALDAAANPQTTPGIAMLDADAAGRFELVTDQADGQAIGLVALSQAAGYELTVTGLVEADIANGSYPPGATNHDVWVVPTTFVDELNTKLLADPEVAPFLPLGEVGGVVGRVREPDCGDGVAGVEIVSRAGAQSTAVIRYLADDGTFTDTATGPSGLFIIVAPALAEKFDAMQGGAIVGEREATVGSAPGGVFAVTVILAK